MISNIKNIKGKNKNNTAFSLNRDVLVIVSYGYHVDTMLVNKTWVVLWALIFQEVISVNNS